MGKLKDLTGMKFGKLKVINLAYTKSRKSYWNCKCDCGNSHISRSDCLQRGDVQSCGCWNIDSHKKETPKYNTKLYHLYYGIIQRCTNPNANKYKDYGGRGITICEDWINSYDVFKMWALQHGYEEGLSIDRINVDKNYEPSNCRWVTQKIQCNNMRTNRNIIYNGETHNITEWAEILGINRNTLNYRLNNNWDLEKAFKKIKN